MRAFHNQWNSTQLVHMFFVHSKNPLIAMVLDKRRHISELELITVLKSRLTVSNDKGIENFIIPTLKFNADSTKLID